MIAAGVGRVSWDIFRAVLLQVRNPMRKQMHAGRMEEWKDCVYKGPYSRMAECIPEYMHVMKYPWSSDMGTLELLQEAMHSGHTVRPPP